MGIPVGNRYTSEVEGTFYRRFTCAHCGFESLAKVRAKGEGEATSYLWLREEGAKSDAQNEAVRKAEEAADSMVACGTCPSCQQRNEEAVSSLRRDGWGTGIGYGVLTTLVLVAIFARTDVGLFFSLLGGLVVPVLHVASCSWMWDADRVEVLSHVEVASLLAAQGVNIDEETEAELAA